MMNVKTKANCEFMDWWKLLNEELQKRDWPECGYGDAKGCYEVGESPETAVEQLIACWS